MPLDPARSEDTRAWLAKAAIDLRAAEHERLADPPITSDMVFHAQQLVEKSLKAYLTWHDQPFRRIHDLTELGQQCVDIEPALDSLLREAATLTEYAWRFRYPGEPDEPGLEEADNAVELARRVYDSTANTHRLRAKRKDSAGELIQSPEL